MALKVFENKKQHLLIHAPHKCIVVFWHISNIPPRIIWEILLYNRQLVVIMYELIHIVQAAHRQGKKIIVQQDYLPLRWMWATDCCQISNIRCTFVGNKIVDHSDVVGAVLTGASSLSTWYMASMDWAKTTARRVDKHLRFGISCLWY